LTNLFLLLRSEVNFIDICFNLSWVFFKYSEGNSHLSGVTKGRNRWGYEKGEAKRGYKEENKPSVGKLG
jgi:hypothetical protein